MCRRALRGRRARCDSHPEDSTCGGGGITLKEGASSEMIRVKRAYDEATAGDGARYLVDRLWPRGVKKTDLRLEGWLKDLAPSDPLRRWFGHDPEKWGEFQRRYFAELDGRSEALAALEDAIRQGTVTLVYAAHDPSHNNAVALKEYLARHRGKRLDGRPVRRGGTRHA